MNKIDEIDLKNDFIVHLARLGVLGKSSDVQVYIKRIAKKLDKYDAVLARSLAALLPEQTAVNGVTRDISSPLVPVDSDSRLALLKQEYPILLNDDPILAADVLEQLEQIIVERQNIKRLQDVGLNPTRTVIFSGPPGVGKTMSARWLAKKLGKPLLTLDLATVMSSYLGKTGANIRSVLEYAKNVECVLLLDELDAIAKKRDDHGDVGELKRLVTVLLQEIDEWPSRNLLVAATNHAELLDPAIWRRFDDVIVFPLPDYRLRVDVIKAAFAHDISAVEPMAVMLSELWEGKSSSEIVRIANWVRRRVIVSKVDFEDALLQAIGRDIKLATPSERKKLLPLLTKLNIADRRISAVTQISRDTLRKYRNIVAVPVNANINEGE